MRVDAFAQKGKKSQSGQNWLFLTKPTTKCPIFWSPSWVSVFSIFPRFVTSSSADSFAYCQVNLCDQIFFYLYIMFGQSTSTLVVFLRDIRYHLVTLFLATCSMVTFLVAFTQFCVIKNVIFFVFLYFRLVLIFLRYQMQRK